MRALILLAALFLCSCAGPRIIPPARHYSAPSAVPVRDRISSAQSHAGKAKAALNTIPTTAEGREAVGTASAEIDALTYELTTAQTALTALEKECGTQTITLNNAEIHLRDARQAALDERAKTQAIVKQRNRVLLVLMVAAFWIFRAPLFGLLRIVMGGI